jgi:hypothetical protein
MPSWLLLYVMRHNVVVVPENADCAGDRQSLAHREISVAVPAGQDQSADDE